MLLCGIQAMAVQGVGVYEGVRAAQDEPTWEFFLARYGDPDTARAMQIEHTANVQMRAAMNRGK